MQKWQVEKGAQAMQKARAVQMARKSAVASAESSEAVLQTTGRGAKLSMQGITAAIQSKDTVIIGTPGYAAPEQFGFHQTDQRADIYALGVLLNNMLTCAMLNEQLTTHKKFQKIIRRCLSIAAKNRYQSCLIVQRELERIVSEHSTRDIRFFRCIPGFRSARLSHMIPASFFYLWAILMVLYFVITFVY